MSLSDAKPIETVCLFARFFEGAGRWDFEIEVRWIDDPTADEEDGTVIEVYGPMTVHFREGEAVRDFAFRIGNVPICGAGRYAFRLMALDGDEFSEYREPLAVEYLEVVHR